MSLITLFLYVGIIAVLLTVAAIYFKKSNNWFLSFWQNFVGVLLIVSGWVKAIDPIGTQYKMEQYFAEFETTCAGSALSFLAPLFPVLSKYALAFGVFMIVLELVLGVMLLIGSRKKWVAWTLFFVMFFFTLLTGFTFLTGYVPREANFFDFAKWGAYEKTNMRVTDCGCFGDFIKLEPRVSFYKDIFLMFPTLLFLFASKSMHHWFNRKSRIFLNSLAIIGFSVFCFRNFYWDLPVVDFRPFKIGTNIKEQKDKEMDAAAKVEIIGYLMQNEKTGETAKAMANGMDAAKFYMEAVKQYPADAGWKVKDQVKTEPAIPSTKISEFIIYDTTENESEVTDLVIEDPKPSLMIVAYKIPHGETRTKTQIIYDSVKIALDTVKVGKELKIITKDTIVEREVSHVEVDWNQDYLNIWHSTIIPFADKAVKAGYKVNIITHDSRAVINDFEKTLKVTGYNFYQADDILLKTIIRSNPGVVLMKGGKVVNMWHYKQLPSFESVKID